MAKPQILSKFAQWRAKRKELWEKSWFANTRLGRGLRSLFGSMEKPATETFRPVLDDERNPTPVPTAAQNDMTANKNLNHDTALQASEAPPSSESSSSANSESTAASATPVAQNHTTSPKGLNRDVALLISNRLELTDAVNLAKSDGFFWRTTGPRVKERVRAYAQEVIDHLVLGRFTAGEAMIQATPKSLFWKAKAKDYAGHDIVGEDGKGVHPYQVALLNGHVSLAQRLAALFTDKNLGMTDGGAELERLRQHKHQLPQGYFVQEEATYTVDYFKTKMQAAVEGNAEALVQFRDDFKPREIRAGTPMRHQALINALLAFEAKWDDWTWPQRQSVWNTFICTILRNASAREAQEFARGLYFFLKGEVAPEAFHFRDESGSFFPLPLGNNGLGFDLDFDFWYGSVGDRARQRAVWVVGLPAYRTSAEQKHKHLETLTSPRSTP